MKKIILITPDFPPVRGGVQRILYNIVNNVPGIEVIAPYSPGCEEFDKLQKFKIHRVPFIKFFPKSALLTLLLKTIMVKPDIIIYGHVVTSFIGIFIRRPNIIFTYGMEVMQNKYKSIFTGLLRNATKITTLSDFTKSFILARNIPSERIVKLYPAIDTGIFNPSIDSAPVINNYNLNGKKIILTVCRMDAREQYKGHETIIKILPEIISKIPEVLWMVVGEGTDRKRIEDLVKRAGLNDYVLFTGEPREEKELLALYSASDIFVMPSGEKITKEGVKAEGFGVVYAEANACGKPAVAYNTGGVNEAIINGVTGLLDKEW